MHGNDRLLSLRRSADGSNRDHQEPIIRDNRLTQRASEVRPCSRNRWRYSLWTVIVRDDRLHLAREAFFRREVARLHNRMRAGVGFNNGRTGPGRRQQKHCQQPAGNDSAEVCEHGVMILGREQSSRELMNRAGLIGAPDQREPAPARSRNRSTSRIGGSPN